MELVEKQVVSKQRVADHGEVLTGKREVNAMLDLVKQETERIESRFLEPACGSGNFLTVILERKLAVVEKRYSKSQLKFERNAFSAASSLYGIEILSDNVSQCRERLFAVFDDVYERLFPNTSKAGCRDAIRFVLLRNIVWGNALTFGTGEKPPKPIVFSEWSFPFDDSRVKRRDFAFSGLLQHEETRESLLFPETKKNAEEQMALFADVVKDDFNPKPIPPDFSPVHFMEIAHVQQ